MTTPAVTRKSVSSRHFMFGYAILVMQLESAYSNN